MSAATSRQCHISIKHHIFLDWTGCTLSCEHSYWIGLGQQKWTHVQLCADSSPLTVVHAYTWFPASRCRFRIRSRNRFRNNPVRTCHSVCRFWGVWAAVARQAQEAGRRVSLAKEWAELQASWLRTERQVRKNRTRSYMNGSTATANLRKRRTLFFT